MKAPMMFTSLGEMRAKPHRRNSSCSWRRAKALPCWCPPTKLWSMQAGLKNAYDSIKAFSETDFTEDLKKFDVPTLVMHGEDDQDVPVKDSAKKSARLIKGGAGNLLSGLAARSHRHARGSSQSLY